MCVFFLCLALQELDLTGSREFLTRESAEELLAPLLAPGAAFRRVRFSTKSFGAEAAEVRVCGQDAASFGGGGLDAAAAAAVPTAAPDTSLQVAARALENVAGTLVDADMSDIIAGRPGAGRG